MSIIVKSGDSTALAHVTPDGALLVAADGEDPGLAGYAKILTSDGREILATENGALTVSADAMVLCEQVDGATVNSNMWAVTTSGMTVGQASGFISLNGAGATTANAYAVMSSVKQIPMYGHLPLKVTMHLACLSLPQANATTEAGIGAVAGGSAATDGCFFRWTPSGEFRAVISSGGTETVSAALTPIPPFDTTLLDIVVVEDLVQFFVDDELVAEIAVPAAQAFPTLSGRLPVFLRCFNSAIAPSTPVGLFLGQLVVTQQGVAQHKPWDHVLAGMGRGGYQSPTGFGQTAQHANSASPASAVLSNTTPAYATLGGRFQFAAPAGAGTDFALFGFQVPGGFALHVGSVGVSAVNTGAAVAATATVLDWSVGVNSSGASLATADSASTWAPRRVPIGLQAFPAGAVVGAVGADLTRAFPTPLVVDSGRYLHIVVQVPVGTATASQVVRGDVTINGYFE